MTDFSGRKVKYGVARELVRGTAINPTYWVRWETADFMDKALTIQNQSAIGVLDKYSGAQVVEAWSEGQIAGKITDQTFGLFLYSALDTYTHTTHAGESTVFDHTFNESQLNAAGTLTVTRVDPNVNNQYTTAMCNSLEIDVKAGDFVRHVTNFIAQPNVAPGAQTVSFVAENEFKAKYCVAKFATTTAGLSGAVAVPLANLKLTISKNVAPYWIVGQNNPGDIFAQAVEVKGEFTLRYSDQTYYNLRFNNTQQACSLTISNTDVNIGVVPSHPTVTFTMPQLHVNDWKFDQKIDGMVEQTVSFNAEYSLSSAFALQALLVNTVSAY